MFSISAKQVFQLLLAVLLTGIIIRIFVVDTFVVQGNSMAPLVQEGDYVFVNKFAYTLWKEPKRNDIIVTRFRTEKPNTIKRVIGLPRERVEITADTIRIKESRADTGTALSEESYLALSQFALNLLPEVTSAATDTAHATTTITLDPEEYLVLGDNRFISTDSRELGPVDKWDIQGRVFLMFRISSLSFSML